MDVKKWSYARLLAIMKKTKDGHPKAREHSTFL